MCAPGRERAWPAREPKFTRTPKLPVLYFLFSMSVFHISTWAWLTPFPRQRYLLTCTDRFNRWPLAIPIPDITAETVVNNVRFGVPRYFTTDRGQQFQSSTFRGLCECVSCSRLRTTAYRPTANDFVERFHCTLKGALRARSNRDRWVENLPLVLLGCRAAVNLRGVPRVRHGFAAARGMFLVRLAFLDPKFKGRAQMSN